MRTLVALSALVLVFMSVASAQDAAKSNVTYYLHLTEGCNPQSDAAENWFIDQNDTEGDIECNMLHDSAGVVPFVVAYEGKAPLGADVEKGAIGTATIYIRTGAPDQVKVAFTFTAGSSTCAGESEEQAVPGAVVVGFNTPFGVACTFSAAAASTVVPSATVSVTARAPFTIGHDGEGASNFVFEGRAPAPAPTNGTDNQTDEPQGDAPSIGVVAGLVGIAALAAIARRHD